ncbi:hypothetical protein SKAU_G00201240 [Synaphobranchus kaupii]|uniref:Uncharacterized protein n=1 Tax=Synaphobranchus kaupii TaxID=118154 RepID=A0A9Q1FFI4_SYNKA|nr:hypothetical protein SKAU_G00201240 [Synaphobranchus kaupii]
MSALFTEIDKYQRDHGNSHPHHLAVSITVLFGDLTWSKLKQDRSNRRERTRLRRGVRGHNSNEAALHTRTVARVSAISPVTGDGRKTVYRPPVEVEREQLRGPGERGYRSPPRWAGLPSRLKHSLPYSPHRKGPYRLHLSPYTWAKELPQKSAVEIEKDGIRALFAPLGRIPAYPFFFKGGPRFGKTSANGTMGRMGSCYASPVQPRQFSPFRHFTKT